MFIVSIVRLGVYIWDKQCRGAWSIKGKEPAHLGNYSTTCIHTFFGLILERLSLVFHFISFLIHACRNRYYLSMSSSSTKHAAQEYPKHPFISTARDILDQLQTNDEVGLHRSTVQEAQERYGPNKLEGEGVVQWHTVLVKQISNAMILVSWRESTTIAQNPPGMPRIRRSFCLAS